MQTEVFKESDANPPKGKKKNPKQGPNGKKTKKTRKKNPKQGPNGKKT